MYEYVNFPIVHLGMVMDHGRGNFSHSHQFKFKFKCSGIRNSGCAISLVPCLAWLLANSVHLLTLPSQFCAIELIYDALDAKNNRIWTNANSTNAINAINEFNYFLFTSPKTIKKKNVACNRCFVHSKRVNHLSHIAQCPKFI